MNARWFPMMAIAGLAACHNTPVLDGRVRACESVPASEYDLRGADAAYAEARIDAEGWSMNEGGQRGRTCVPETGGATIGLEDRRCVQRNALYVRLDDSSGARYFRVPAGKTYAIYARDGAAVCDIVEAN